MSPLIYYRPFKGGGSVVVCYVACFGVSVEIAVYLKCVQIILDSVKI